MKTGILDMVIGGVLGLWVAFATGFVPSDWQTKAEAGLTLSCDSTNKITCETVTAPCASLIPTGVKIMCDTGYWLQSCTYTTSACQGTDINTKARCWNAIGCP